MEWWIFSACTSRDNNANTQCDDAEFDGHNEPVPGTGAKCNCGEFNGNPNPAEIPNIAIDKTCADTFIAPGASTICTIVISNSGIGDMGGAVNSTDEGFFFEADFPEDRGSVSLIMGPDLDPTPNS